MSDEQTADALGNKSKERLTGLASMISGHLNEISDHQEKVKGLYAEAKTEGFNLKVMRQIIKEQRKGPKFQADQLQLEMELSTYREAVDLPTDLETAQKLAAEEAERMPQPPKKRAKATSEDDDGDNDRTPNPRKDLN